MRPVGERLQTHPGCESIAGRSSPIRSVPSFHRTIVQVRYPATATNTETSRTKLAQPCTVSGYRANEQNATGARRQTVVYSVLESLRQYVPSFTLRNVVAEIKRWSSCGRSCFAELLEKPQLSSPDKSILDTLCRQHRSHGSALSTLTGERPHACVRTCACARGRH